MAPTNGKKNKEDSARQWNRTLVNADGAMRRLTGHTTGQPDWKHVRIAHLDSGYTEHPVFGDWATGTGPFLPKLGFNYISGKKDSRDPVKNVGMAAGHGTRTGSVLSGDLSGTPSFAKYGTRLGIAPRVPIVPYRVTNVNILVDPDVVDNLAAAIMDALRPEKRVQIISISLGSPFLLSRSLGRAVDCAYEKGVIIVAAGGQVVSPTTYPGKFQRTIGVGGVTPKKKVWWHYEPAMLSRIDTWGPADRIFRADTQLKENNSLDYLYAGDGDGTSYATVHVAAAAAYWLEHRWGEIEAAYMSKKAQRWRRVEAFRSILRKTGSVINQSGGTPGPSPKKPKRLKTTILDIDAVMRAKLPAVGSLTKSGVLAADECL